MAWSLPTEKNSSTWPAIKIHGGYYMPVLALRLTDHSNAVSEMHGVVARKMWHPLWPNLREEDVPITHITNGVHTGSWLARRLRHLYDRYLDSTWHDNLDNAQIWEKIEDIPDPDLWTVRKHLAARLLICMARRAVDRYVHPVQVIAAEYSSILTP
jgi:starch phosphorylase